MVGAEALAKQAITSERDLQFATPGLTVRTSQNDNQLNYLLRGQTVDAYTSSLPSVLPYVNEVQVGGAGSNAFFDLQSVQVLKGPQGTLFGRNSTGGAMLFTTAKPTGERTGYGAARYGRFNDMQVEGAVNGPVSGDKLLARVADYYAGNGTSISPVVTYVVPVAKNVPGNPFVTNNIYFPGHAAFGAAQNARGPYAVDVDSLSNHRNRKWIISNITSLEINDNTKLKNVFGYVNSDYLSAGNIMDGGLEYVAGVYYVDSKEHLRNTSFILNGIGLPPQINAGTTTSKAITGYAQATLDTGLAGFKFTGAFAIHQKKLALPAMQMTSGLAQTTRPILMMAAWCLRKKTLLRS